MLQFFISSTERATVERLAAHFDSCVEQAVSLVLSLPDGDFKQDLLHVSKRRLLARRERNERPKKMLTVTVYTIFFFRV